MMERKGLKQDLKWERTFTRVVNGTKVTFSYLREGPNIPGTYPTKLEAEVEGGEVLPMYKQVTFPVTDDEIAGMFAASNLKPFPK